MPSPLHGRRVLVTGATDGIGRHTAAALAGLGAHVTIVGRDPTRGRAVADEIAGDFASRPVEFLSADLSSQAAVRTLADTIARRGIDILVNNVGGLYTERWETVDGVEASLAVNALNPFLLTELLLPSLAAHQDARVVYVTGGMPGRVDLTDLENRRDYLGIRAYSHAKTVLMALAREQADRTRAATVNVAYPGAADTPMTRAMTPATVPWQMRLLWPLFRPAMNRARPERAARSSVRLATDPGLIGVTGRYVDSAGRPARWPRQVRDASVRRSLWDIATRLTDPTGTGPRPMSGDRHPTRPAPARSEGEAA